MIKYRVQKHGLMRKIYFHLNLTMSKYPLKKSIRGISLNTAIELNWLINVFYHVYAEVINPGYFFDLKATQFTLKLKPRLPNLDRFFFFLGKHSARVMFF